MTPMYLAFKLYTENTGAIALNTQTTSDYYLSSGMVEVPFLECSATRDQNGKTLHLALLNRHEIHSIRCTIELRNFDSPRQCTFQELTARNVTAKNDFLCPNNVRITGGSIGLDGNPFIYTVPPHSVTILNLKQNAYMSSS